MIEINSVEHYKDVFDYMSDNPNENVLYKCNIQPFLFVACIIGNVEEIKKLIEKGGLMNQVYYWGNALHYALLYKNTQDVAEFLIQNGVNFDDKDTQGFTPLIHACYNQYENIVDMLLDRNVNVNPNGGHGRTALNIALKTSLTAPYNNSIAKKLIYKGAYIDGDNSYGEIPLTITVITKNKEMYDYLLELGADKNKIDYNGYGKSAKELCEMYKLNNW